jgi:ABC-2 type transport system ATP-binding protein
VRGVTVKACGLDVRVESSEKALPSILEAANRLGCQLDSIEYRRPRLDDVFIAYTGHRIREEFPAAEAE